MSGRIWRASLASLLAAGLAACGGGEDRAGPDPEGDPDRDGLTTAWEQRHGLDPFNRDTDGDGAADGNEVYGGTSDPEGLDAPTDSDGDGVMDALESGILDPDGDCLPDQVDPEDDVPGEDPRRLAAVGCLLPGVCEGGRTYIRASCEAGQIVCDLSEVPGWLESDDRCDGLDNDCDGSVDEGFTLLGIPLGYACEAEGVCGKGVVECASGGASARCSSGPGGSNDRSSPEVCNGRDDDCDGQTDEDLMYLGAGVGEPCDGEGECGQGTVVCDDGGHATCSTNPGLPGSEATPEVCDGLDNDCDGTTDDDATVTGTPTEHCTPTGVCAVGTAEAVLVCRDGRPGCDWTGVPGYSGPVEAACDGLDDDCDGPTDEDFAVLDPLLGPAAVGQPCGTGVCAGGVVTCGPGSAATCSTAVKAVAETCNQVDDDCDGAIDNGLYKVYAPSALEAGTGAPRPRAFAALAPVAGSNSLVSYGGASRTAPDGSPIEGLSDFWRYDLALHRFFRIHGGGVEPSPGPRAGARLVPDPSGARVFLVGGVIGPAAPDGPVWQYVLASGTWSQVDAAVPQTGSVGAGYDASAGVLVVVRTDLGGGARMVTVDLDTNETTSMTLPLPYARLAAFAALPDGAVVVSGGYSSLGLPSANLHVLGADGSIRGAFGEADGLPRRAAHVVAALSDGAILLIGGVGAPGGAPALDVIRFDPATRKVEPVATSPELRLPGAAVTGDRVWLYSGIAEGGRALHGVLRLDPGAGAWVNDLLDVAPVARADGHLVVVPSRRAAWMVGGWTDDLSGRVPLTEVWSLSLVSGALARIGPPGSTPVSVDGAATVDEAGGLVYLHGGLDGPPGLGKPAGGLARLKPGGDGFELLADAAGTRRGHVMAWIGEPGRFLLHGGELSGKALGDAWRIIVDKGAVTWEKLPFAPLPRYGHRAAWDAARGRLLVVGGVPDGDLCALDPTGAGWTTLATHPSFAVEGGAAFLDADSGHLLFMSPAWPRAVLAVLKGDGTVDVKELDLAPPPVFPGAASALDPFGRQAVLFGGTEKAIGVSASTWVVPEVCP